MILWCDGDHDPAENMRRDARLLARVSGGHEHGGREPVLRLFCFRPAGITLGYGQDPRQVLDLERCRRDGVPWAIRPTGGGAIFHAEEWTYSLSAPLADPEWGGSLSLAYARASRLIEASLLRLGIPAVLAGRRPLGESAPPRLISAACFARAARHEIVLEGRKLVGSAQRRTAAGLLQQGSVLLGMGHLRLANYLAVPERERSAVRGALLASATGADAYLGGYSTLERWAVALAEELLPGVHRLEGAAGRFLLTLPETHSYTRQVSVTESRPVTRG